MTVSIDRDLYEHCFGEDVPNRSRVVQEALALYRADQVRREVESFCAGPEPGEAEEVEGFLGAQREILDP